jgi:hypothetical protein
MRESTTNTTLRKNKPKVVLYTIYYKFDDFTEKGLHQNASGV